MPTMIRNPAETASWMAACDELESLLSNVKTTLDLVALVHLSRHAGEQQTNAARTESKTMSSSVTQHHHGLYMESQHRQRPSIIPPLSRARPSVASSIYSVSDKFALEDARLTEPFSPDLIPPAFWSDSDDDDEEGSRAFGEQFELEGSIPLCVTASPQSNPTSPASLNLAEISPVVQDFCEEVETTFYPQGDNMTFGESIKNSAAAYRRRSMATTSALTDYEADLTSKDRIKQKDAIRRILAGKVKDDWIWEWPKEEDYGPATPIVNRSQEDLAAHKWTERDEWISNKSESEEENDAAAKPPIVSAKPTNKNPFRFDSPDGVGETVRRTVEDRKTRRRRKLDEEMQVNDGLRCFTHRRNAWTGARHVRHTRRTLSTSSSFAQTLTRNASKASSDISAPSPRSQVEDFLDLTTEIPIAPPILPPETPMRKGINERTYGTIYDKVIQQSQTPFCPINLSVITKSCVEGWKRDGEWPPKTLDIEAVMAGVGKTSLTSRDTVRSSEAGTSNSLQRRESDTPKNKSMIRRSIQKVMGAVRERAGSKGKDGEIIFNQ